MSVTSDFRAITNCFPSLLKQIYTNKYVCTIFGPRPSCIYTRVKNSSRTNVDLGLVVLCLFYISKKRRVLRDETVRTVGKYKPMFYHSGKDQNH